jgi:hypothetical protein
VYQLRDIIVKIYHYSTERFPFIKTRREQGVSESDLEEAVHKAKKMGLPLPYVDHVSFFIDPIPKETIAAIFSNKHPFWKAGQTLYEHVIDTKDINEKSFYRIVETPEIDKYTDQFDWTVKDLSVRSKYFVEMNKEMLRLGYSGYSINKMVKMCQRFIGKTEGYYIKARQRPDAADSEQLYAGNVPHLMIYPMGGVIPVESKELIKLGSAKPIVTDLLYHLSFNDKLPTTLYPRQPMDSTVVKGKFVEELPPRISFSPTIQQCFSALYPNISKYFEEENYPHMDMYVYVPVGKSDRISNKEVNDKVWDAHITGEVCFKTPTKVMRVAKIRIFNPGNLTSKNCIYAQPFNNPMAKCRFVAPIITFAVIDEYLKVPVL